MVHTRSFERGELVKRVATYPRLSFERMALAVFGLCPLVLRVTIEDDTGAKCVTYKLEPPPTLGEAKGIREMTLSVIPPPYAVVVADAYEPTAVGTKTCGTCRRNCDVGRPCWWCGCGN